MIVDLPLTLSQHRSILVHHLHMSEINVPSINKYTSKMYADDHVNYDHSIASYIVPAEKHFSTSLTYLSQLQTLVG